MKKVLVAVLVVCSASTCFAGSNTAALAKLISTSAYAGAEIAKRCTLDGATEVIVNHVSADQAQIKIESCIHEGLDDEGLSLASALKLVEQAQEELNQ